MITYLGLLLFSLQSLEIKIDESIGNERVGAIQFLTDTLKLSLVTEARAWKQVRNCMQALLKDYVI